MAFQVEVAAGGFFCSTAEQEFEFFGFELHAVALQWRSTLSFIFL